MTYFEWFEAHADKHKVIMDTLAELSDSEVIEYFSYENMKEKHVDFCPLYTEDKKCHEMEDLNCYLCACMHFRFSDKGIREEAGKTLYSLCKIEAKEGKAFVSDDAIHQDCSGCLIPHKKSVIEKHFSRDWREVMKKSLMYTSIDNPQILN